MTVDRRPANPCDVLPGLARRPTPPPWITPCLPAPLPPGLPPRHTLHTHTHPAGDSLVQDFDGSRLSRLPDGRWSVELDGLAPVLGSPEGLSISPCAGVQLVWQAATRCVVATLPDGSCLSVGPAGGAAYSPRGVRAPTGAVAAPMGLGGGLESVASSIPCRGTFFFDLAAGAAAFTESEDLHFFLPGPAALATAATVASAAAAAAAAVQEGAPGGSGEASEAAVQAAPPLPGFWPEAAQLQHIEYPPAQPESPDESAGAEGEDGEEGERRPAGGDGDDNGDDEGGGAGSSGEGGGGRGRAREHAPTPPPPEPIVTVLPVAPSIRPRIFAIFPNGSGVEILDTEAVDEYMAATRALGRPSGDKSSAASAGGRWAGGVITPAHEAV